MRGLRRRLLWQAHRHLHVLGDARVAHGIAEAAAALLEGGETRLDVGVERLKAVLLGLNVAALCVAVVPRVATLAAASSAVGGWGAR